MKRRTSNLTRFLKNKANCFISFNDPLFILKLDKIIEQKERDGYISFENVPIKAKILSVVNFKKEIPFVIRKGKLVKIYSDHNVDGVIIKKVLTNIFINPIAIIKDESISKLHERVTYNFVSRFYKNKKPYYVIIELDGFCDFEYIKANIIKTIYDKKDYNKLIEKIIKKEKAGQSLLYLE